MNAWSKMGRCQTLMFGASSVASLSNWMALSTRRSFSVSKERSSTSVGESGSPFYLETC